MAFKFLSISLGIFALIFLASESSCQRSLNAPHRGMLVMNDAGTVAVAFCPLGSVLVKDGKPLIFPFKFVYAEDRWVTEPVDPSGGDLIPIPDCTPISSKASFMDSVAEFFQYKGDCKSREVQEVMKQRTVLIGACPDSSCTASLIVTCG